MEDCVLLYVRGCGGISLSGLPGRGYSGGILLEYVHAADTLGRRGGVSGGEGLWLRSADFRPVCGLLSGLAWRKQRRFRGSVRHPAAGRSCLFARRPGSDGSAVPFAAGLGT